MTHWLRHTLTLQDRRFVAGNQFVVSGLQFRIREGRKRPDDLVIEWLTPSGWRAIEFGALFLLTDFLYENEHWLYPPPKEGGEYLRRYLRDAVKCGWERADRALQLEKAQRRQQGSLFDSEAS